jgi:hypothetical protein
MHALKMLPRIAGKKSAHSEEYQQKSQATPTVL